MKKIFGLVLMILVAFTGFTVYTVWNLLQPADVNDDSLQTVVVNQGENLTTISQKLAEKGLLKSSWSLRILNRLDPQDKPVQAGGFRLSPSMSPQQILDTLATGRRDIWVTLTEGWRREQMAEALAAAFTDNGATFDPEQFLSLTRGKEGYLFPAKYLFPLYATEAEVVSVLENELEKKLGSEITQAIQKTGYSQHQILTMASIIEREAKASADRRLVSGILWKRLQSDWPLQVDATMQYAMGFDTASKNWWKPPTAADKNSSSPYNTYQNIGLPPGPICAPSLDSIEAAVYPEENDYWFYISDKSGKNMHYATTLDQHNANINKYLR